MAANMLVAYYDRTCDSSAQSARLGISSGSSYSKHLNRYDVVHINMQDVLSAGGSMDIALDRLGRVLCQEVARAYPEACYLDESSVPDVLADAHALARAPFVFVIDEWDCVFRAHKDGRAAQARYLDWLRAVLKDKAYVALAYMAGILPIRKHGQHSALNMFDEFSMTYARPISSCAGFTESEVAVLCGRFHSDLAQMRRWYDGHDVDDVAIYNPRSVAQALLSGGFSNFCTQTETFEALRVYIEMDMDGLRGKVVRLVAGEEAPVDATTFQNDMAAAATADDVLTLLVHLGYLTCDSRLRLARIPSHEVAEQFASTLRASGWHEAARSPADSDRLVAAALAGDADEVARLVQESHEGA